MSRRHKCIKPVRVKTHRQQRRAMRRLLVPANLTQSDDFIVATDRHFLAWLETQARNG